MPRNQICAPGSDLTSITRRRRPTCRPTRNRALVFLSPALSVIALPCAATTTPIPASAASTQSRHPTLHCAFSAGRARWMQSVVREVKPRHWASPIHPGRAACAISDARPTGPLALTESPRCSVQTELPPRYARRSPMPDPTSTTYELTIRSLALAPGDCAVRRACLSPWAAAG